jgi:hypothetical protein
LNPSQRFALIGIVFTSGAAQAAFIEYASVFAPQIGSYSTVFSVQKFDPMLGTLSGVSLALDAQAKADLQVFNATAIAQTFSNASATIPLTVDVTTPDGLQLSITALSTVLSGVALPGLNTYAGITSTAATSQALAPSQWGNYLGTGGGAALFSASFSEGRYAGQAPFLVFFSGQAEAGGGFKVRYDYEPAVAVVPLPASLPLLLAGALGLAFVRRRRGA